jgi:PTH1 family peptidyl-tRNA hydrolase
MLVVGLGNPGERYARTRHNAGWWVVETLVGRLRAQPAGTTSEYRSWSGRFREKKVDLLQPLTFMNRSGEAIARWSEVHEFDVAAMLVVADDVYLPEGMLRLRAGGSTGGHRGLESIETTLGTRDYARLRIGVGAVGSADQLKEHVLAPPDAAGEALWEEAIGRAADAVECWIGEGLLAAMNRFNRKVRKEATEP